MSTSPDSFLDHYGEGDEHTAGRGSPYGTPSYNGSSIQLENNEKFSVMVKYLYQRINVNGWMSTVKVAAVNDLLPQSYGVLLRAARGQYVCQPTNLHHELLAAVQKINVEVAFTMSTESSDVIFSSILPGQTELVLPDGSQFQIMESMTEIRKSASNRVKKFQYACLVRRERTVLIWHDDIHKILNHAQEIERKLLGLIWGDSVPTLNSGASISPSMYPGSIGHGSPAPSIHNGSGFFTKTKLGPSSAMNEIGADITDEEKAINNKESLARPLVLTSSIMIGLAMCLMLSLLGLSLSILIYEYMMDGGYLRFLFALLLPLFDLFGLFFFMAMFSCLWQLCGPIKGAQTNSRFHSAIAPNVAQAEREGFGRPHMTIQMPVYKESLAGVIKPTITSLKEAISHYELCGGTANIFVNDDGLQIIPEAEAKERIDFYHDNNIGWVSRPKHGSNGFIRAGKFKKASNMNFALNISNKVEERLAAMIAQISGEKNGFVTSHEEEELYNRALQEVVAKDGRAQAAGNIRVGEFILIVDSDTRIPSDCLLYGAAEMFLSPEVAIIQHNAGVMQVVHDYFENGITFFTDMVYSAIRFSIGSGEVAPFVGHNAFLRWAAVQSVSMKRPDGYELFWSESHVSEDFDIALRLQIQHNIVRLASYHGDGFKEGVSLTIYDELARWEKYAYGCNELVFNPLYTWLWKGPFSGLFIRFLRSNLQLSSKLGITAYIFTYYAIAAALPFTIFNYFFIGWFQGSQDSFYTQSWNVWISVVVVFSLLGNFSLAVLRYRMGEGSFFPGLWTNYKWLPMFTIFFGGLAFHVNLALLAHLFSINMEWGATAKEVENSNFFKELPKIFKSFKYMYLFCVPMVAAMIYLGTYAPHGWEIKNFAVILPLASLMGSHILLPFVLNPSLMVFNY